MRKNWIDIFDVQIETRHGLLSIDRADYRELCREFNVPQDLIPLAVADLGRETEGQVVYRQEENIYQLCLSARMTQRRARKLSPEALLLEIGGILAHEACHRLQIIRLGESTGALFVESAKWNKRHKVFDRFALPIAALCVPATLTSLFLWEEAALYFVIVAGVLTLVSDYLYKRYRNDPLEAEAFEQEKIHGDTWARCLRLKPN